MLQTHWLAFATSLVFSLPGGAGTIAFGTGEHRFNLEFVDIRSGEVADDTGYGAVPYDYRIGVHEVSRAMVLSFNALSGERAMTMRDPTLTNGKEPSHPATGVSWNDAARFVNWLNMSQGHPPAYIFPTVLDINGNIRLWPPDHPGFNPSNPFRNSKAVYFLPSEDEWYRAAYYDSVAERYWDYPTGSDELPTPVPSGTAPGTAVHSQAGSVGPAYTFLAGGLSPFGTMGQGGNVMELTESALDPPNDSPRSNRAARGGYWVFDQLESSRRWLTSPGSGQSDIGFRVAAIPPKQSKLQLKIVRLDTNFLSLTVDNLPHGRQFHLRQSGNGMTFEPLSPAINFDHTTPQPIEIPVDVATSAVHFLQACEGATPFMEMVTIGNTGNPPDAGNASAPDTMGAVPYTYRIGKWEVTNNQYATFLNAVGRSDSGYLYNTDMEASVHGGIARSGFWGSYAYTVKPGMGSKPVNFVNWHDAARFCNWMHNGRPSGDIGPNTTEVGAYTLAGSSGIRTGTDPIHGPNGRNLGALYHLPSDDEWYKAAYHQPHADGGDTDGYWLYPTRSNSPPAMVVPPGAPNSANYGSIPGTVSEVGAYVASSGFYGTFDQAGNVREWNEKNLSGGHRRIRGGAHSWPSPGGTPTGLESVYAPSAHFTSFEGEETGFRIAAP